MSISKETLHPKTESNVDIYPKTSIDQVVGLEADLLRIHEALDNNSNAIDDVNDRLLTDYQEKMIFTDYSFTTEENITSFEYSLHNPSTKIFIFYLDSGNVELIPSQNINTTITINNNNFNSPSFPLITGLTGHFYYKCDCTEPAIFQEMGSYRYYTYGQNVYQITPRLVNVNSFTKFKIRFSGDGIPAGLSIHCIEGV